MMLIWTFLPLRGPIASLGRILPAPIGVVNEYNPFWYHQLLRVKDWHGEEFNKTEVIHFTAFAVLVDSFAKEMEVFERRGFRSFPRSIQEVHDLALGAADVAAARGVYQKFAEARVAQMQGLIDLGIFFQDLAYQYTELPSDWTNGVRILSDGDLPDVYRDLIDVENPTLVDFDDYFVFVRVLELQGDEYRVIELGIAKQNVRETVYSFLEDRSIRWF